MEVYLYGRNAETLPAKVSKMLQLFHGGICLADHDTLAQGSTASNFGYLARFLVHPFSFLGLHGSACLFLDHPANGIVILLQGHVALLL